MSADPLAWLVSLEGVPSAFAGARDGIDAVLRDRGLRRTSPEMTAESLLRGAHASAVLEGSAASLTEVREGAGDEIAADAVRVSTELLALIPVVRRTPLQAFARLHALAGHGSVPADRLGRPRDPESAGVLRTIADIVTAPTEAPALAVAAIVHAELFVNAPFASHNGVVARAAERLLLAAKGVDEKSLVVPEAAHLALRAEYESNLRGYASGTTSGIHAWLLYAAEAYAAAAEASPLVRAAE
ncbi:oxidoreductase [Nocardioides humilatus]|uniref:Oxidoreductase n=1 Tax=Nocardioides humilatus TaxID=2607660 RepID=A0A5B1LKM2_9ACTN|nr:oxidoreductase [Nocardioides humilatus]KAA1420300.1 oxidoreductase [Nocardioides humilatus]